MYACLHLVFLVIRAFALFYGLTELGRWNDFSLCKFFHHRNILCERILYHKLCKQKHIYFIRIRNHFQLYLSCTMKYKNKLFQINSQK